MFLLTLMPTKCCTSICPVRPNTFCVLIISQSAIFLIQYSLGLKISVSDNLCWIIQTKNALCKSSLDIFKQLYEILLRRYNNDCIWYSDPESDSQGELKATHSVRCRPTWEINLYPTPGPGVDPGSSALKTSVLPLGHRGSAAKPITT